MTAAIAELTEAINVFLYKSVMLILSWIEKNLEGCADPRAFGKGLTANRSGEWRYRVGSYRILALIVDERLVVEVFKVGHRSNVYM